MEKNSFTIFLAVLLIFYGIVNIGSAVGQFTKAKAFSGTTSFAVEMGRIAGDRARAQELENQTSTQSFILYSVGFLILVTIIFDFAGAIGMFGGQSWAISIVITAALLGFAVEIQDVMEDGFGVFNLIYFIINGIAFFTAIKARAQKKLTVDGTT